MQELKINKEFEFGPSKNLKYKRIVSVINNYENRFKILGKKNQGKQIKVIKPIDTQKELARIANTSRDTIHRVKFIEEKGTNEQKELLLNNKISINKMYLSLSKKDYNYTKSEKVLQNKFKKRLNEKYKEYYKCKFGIIDIITENNIYEIKLYLRNNNISGAIGQLLCYQKAFKKQYILNIVSNVSISAKYKKLLEEFNINFILSK